MIDFIKRRAQARGIQLPNEDIERWLHEQKAASRQSNPDNRAGKGKNWPVFDFCNTFLQTADELREATTDILDRLFKQQNVVYAEIRFCPFLHTNEGLSCAQALEAVMDGFRAQSDVAGGVIVCALRSKDKEHGVEMAELAAKYLQPNGRVVGFDVAGDEGSYPLYSEDHPMYAGCLRAKNLGVSTTIHAGEWPEKSLENGVVPSIEDIRFAFNFGAKRIGHGIALRSAPSLVKLMAERSDAPTIEVCLTSNVAGGFKVKEYSAHPVKIMYENRLPFTLSMDNWLLSGDCVNRPNSVEEILHLVKDVFVDDPITGWRAVQHSLICGIHSAFDASIKDAFKKDFIDAVSSITAKRLDELSSSK